MTQAFYIDNDKEGNFFRFFYEHERFYHAFVVDSEHPFKVLEGTSGTTDYPPNTGKSLQEWAEFTISRSADKLVKNVKFSKTDNRPGVYYPRMWRGNMQYLSGSMLAGSQTTFSKAIVAGRLITERLFDIFSYIEPIPSNLSVFGHKLRELLLLSCMEVESSWAAVLTANGYQPKKPDRFITKDYVKLRDPMLLSRYEVEFPMYPEIGPFMPFESWQNEGTTKSLPWYDAYNRTKHNRENNFNAATLRNAIVSVCAVAVMLCAQFGPDSVPLGIQVTLKNVDPNWPYIPLRRAKRTTNKDGTSPITESRDSFTWTKENYKFQHSM